MSVFTHLNEVGEKIYEEVVHDIESVEAWINQHFGSIPVPEGHTILKDGEPVDHKPVEEPHDEEEPHEEKPKAPEAELDHHEEHKDEAPVPGPEDLIPEAKE